jgi:hypothetical protein
MGPYRARSRDTMPVGYKVRVPSAMAGHRERARSTLRIGVSELLAGLETGP